MDMRGTITPLLDALARGAAAGAPVRAQRHAADAAAGLARLARDSPAECAALAADARVVPALAAASSSHADGAVVEAAMVAAAKLVSGCPDAAMREQQASLVRLGALEAAVQRLSAGGSVGGAAALLLGALAKDRPEDVAAAAVAAGALPRLVALMRDANLSAAEDAAGALASLVDGARSPVVAPSIDASAVGALAELLARGGLSVASHRVVLRLLAALAQAPAGSQRLVTDGALPHVVRLLRSPAWSVAGEAVLCLAAAFPPGGGGAVAEALLADATAAPALLALLLGRHGDSPLHAATALCMTMEQTRASFSPAEARRRTTGLAAAIRRAGAVPRLVELLRAPFERDPRRCFTTSLLMAGLAHVSRVDSAAAREALAAGAWPAACRLLVEQDARGESADEDILAQSLPLLAALATHLLAGAPGPAAAAEPGLSEALARALRRAAARVSLGAGGTRAVSPDDATTAGSAAAALEAALADSDGAERAAEFVDAGGAGHLVRARRRWSSGSRGRGLSRLRMWARRASLQPAPLSHPRRIPAPPAARGAASDARQRCAILAHSVDRESSGAARVRPCGAARRGRRGRAACRDRVAAGALGACPRRGARVAAAPARARSRAAFRRPRAAAVRRLRRERVARQAAHALQRLPRPRALVQRRVPAARLARPQARVSGEEGRGGGCCGVGGVGAAVISVMALTVEAAPRARVRPHAFRVSHDRWKGVSHLRTLRQR
jgi:hypothetical protein